jgi:hypothetical protein
LSPINYGRNKGEHKMDKYILQKGDMADIHTDDYTMFAFGLIYVGKTKNGDYKFRSNVYGWYYFISKDKEMFWLDESPEKKWMLDKKSAIYNALP